MSLLTVDWFGQAVGQLLAGVNWVDGDFLPDDAMALAKEVQLNVETFRAETEQRLSMHATSQCAHLQQSLVRSQCRLPCFCLLQVQAWSGNCAQFSDACLATAVPEHVPAQGPLKKARIDVQCRKHCYEHPF
jgi:hypothetical protein